MGKNERLYLVLEYYFSSAEAASGYASNYGDMVTKMAQSSAEAMQTDSRGNFDHGPIHKRLKVVGRLRRTRSALLECSYVSLLTIGCLFSDDATAHRNGALHKKSIQHARLSPIIKAADEYAKTNPDPECFWLLKLAAAYNTPPERLKRIALREFSNAFYKGDK